MKKMTAAIGPAALLAVPVGAEAEPKPDQGDMRAAVAQCKSERGKTKATGVRRGVREEWNRRTAFGKCVSRKGREA